MGLNCAFAKSKAFEYLSISTIEDLPSLDSAIIYNELVEITLVN